jgi:hypothetical protein
MGKGASFNRAGEQRRRIAARGVKRLEFAFPYSQEAPFDLRGEKQIAKGQHVVLVQAGRVFEIGSLVEELIAWDRIGKGCFSTRPITGVSLRGQWSAVTICIRAVLDNTF